MKIGISSTGKDVSSPADPRFGRCEVFAIYDTEDNSYRFIDNKAQSAGGGAGIAAAQQMIDEDVEAILTGNMGPNAYNVIVNAGIKVYRIGNVTLEKALQLFKEAKLEAINEAGSAHFGYAAGLSGRFLAGESLYIERKRWNRQNDGRGQPGGIDERGILRL